MTQLDMFGAAQAAVPTLPTADSVRPRLVEVLEQLRAASELPWTDAEARRWRVVFPQMTNWLPAEEGAHLRSEFSELLDRLAA